MINLTDHVFYPLDRNFKNRLIKKLHISETDFINELSILSQKYSLTSTIIENQIMWKGHNNVIHLILHFGIKAHEIKKILKVYRYTRNHQDIQNFILVDQTNTYKQAYDIFRLTRLSFMQHCNHFRIKKNDLPIHNPENVQAGIYTLFGPLKPHQQYRWGRIFAYQETVKETLEKECIKHNHNQVVEGDYIFWTDKQDEIKCMFRVIYDPSNIDIFIKLYSEIIERNIRLTYCIVNQFPDGRYEFDIFRLSEISYLEHYNRVRPSGPDLYKLIK